MSTLDEEIIALEKRFNSILHTFETRITNLTPSILFGVWSETFTELLKTILHGLKKDLEGRIFPSSKEEKKVILTTLNDRLDDLTSLHENILSTLCRNSAIHEFVSYTLRDLDIAKDTPYLISIRQSLVTNSLIRSYRNLFQGPVYKTTNENLDQFLETNKINDFSIFFIPPSVLEQKTYWSLIIHEIGHVLNDRYSLTEEFNKHVEQNAYVTQHYTNYYFGREFVCDYIASLYCGPVYYDSLNEYLGEIGLVLPDERKTHPSREARLYFLQESLKDKIENKKLISEIPKISPHTLVENLDEIIERTCDILFDGNKTSYQKNSDEITKSVKQLKNLTPYVGEPRILLNSYSNHALEIIEKIKKNSNQNDIEVIDDLGRIIEDSIRITNMKRTFDFME